MEEYSQRNSGKINIFCFECRKCSVHTQNPGLINLVARGGSTIGFPGKCNIFHKINRFVKSVKTEKCYGICLKKFEEKKFRVQNVHPGFI